MARIKRGGAIDSDLVFAAESFGAACAALSKASGCAIVRGVKRTVARDFQLDLKQAQAAADENAAIIAQRNAKKLRKAPAAAPPAAPASPEF